MCLCDCFFGSVQIIRQLDSQSKYHVLTLFFLEFIIKSKFKHQLLVLASVIFSDIIWGSRGMVQWWECLPSTSVTGIDRVRTGSGKPEKSWNFIVSFSTSEKSWKSATSPEKWWKFVKLEWKIWNVWQTVRRINIEILEAQKFMWILESWKNQSESWKSPGNFFREKGTNPDWFWRSAISGLSLFFILILLQGFFSRFSGFPPFTRTNISKSQFDQDRGPTWKEAEANVASSQRDMNVI